MTRALLIVVLLLLPRAAALAVDEEVLRAEAERVAAIEKASRSFVAIFANGGAGGGSGVVISPEGYALTNFHVANPSGKFMKCGMNDGRMYDAVLVGLDPTGDVAMVKLLGRNDFIPAPTANSDEVQPGDWCFAVGNPFLLSTNLEPTVTYGLVSGVHRCQYPAGTLLEYTDAIQTDASINPGNSGGPLFNARGELIGIIGSGSFDKRGRVNVGVGYAISINQIKNFVGHLRGGRLVDHATLGATVATSDDSAVFVRNILESSDAFRRGLRYGDEVLEFGGKNITSANGFKSVLGTFPQGWRVPLAFRREGKTIHTQVRLAGLLTPEQLAEKAKAFREEAPKLPIPKIPGGKPPEKPKPEAAKKPEPEADASAKGFQKLFEPRDGFANYYFNRLERDRVLKAYRSLAGAWPDQPWRLQGEVVGQGKFEIELNNKESSGKFLAGKFTVDNERDFDQQLGPPNSGGLVAALHLWRLFTLQSSEAFGDVTYGGQRPFQWGEPLLDYLVATKNIAELELTCDAQGRPVTCELFVEPDADPCELRFTKWDDTKKLPRTIEVWCGDRQYGVIDSLSFGPTESSR